MKRGKKDNDLHRAVALVADGELRVKRQKQLVKTLKRDGRSTATAERLLSNYERSLTQFRNYLQLLELLRKK
jgi:hypothetical protein